ncbi:MAG TPA: hypothetical protein VGS59_00590 [Candidatus Acidoferrales bacterium]|nr:hypothetical protein [Candidatus Acidoferrales bacterium]
MFPIRPAVLAGQLGYSSTAGQLAVRLHEILQDVERFILVAECEGSELAGYIEVIPFRTIGSNPRIEVGGACLSKNPAALRASDACSWSALRNGPALVVSRKQACVPTSSGRAHRVYENPGYSVNRTQESFRKTL